MSKASRRPTWEARKQHKQKCREAHHELRARQAAAGLKPPRAASSVNRLSPYRTEAEEQAAREDAVAGQLGVFRALLPKLLKGLSKIPDPRQPKKIKHKLTVVLLYGLLSSPFSRGQVCVSDGFAARGQPGVEPSGVYSHLASIVSRAGIATACRHAASAVAGDRGSGRGRDACGVAAAVGPEQEIPSLLDWSLNSAMNYLSGLLSYDYNRAGHSFEPGD